MGGKPVILVPSVRTKKNTRPFRKSPRRRMLRQQRRKEQNEDQRAKNAYRMPQARLGKPTLSEQLLGRLERPTTRSPSSALLPFLFLGRVPLLK